MNSFIAHHATKILGVISGFDRLVLRGSLRSLCHASGVMSFLERRNVPIGRFTAFAKEITENIRCEAERWAESAACCCPSIYLTSSSSSKEETARLVADVDGVRRGPVCLLSALEPCSTFKLRRNRETGEQFLKKINGKCLFYYFYVMHPRFGLIHVRLQTWFPFHLQVWINGREYLARQMEQAGIDHHRETNCFTWIEDFDAAQGLMDNFLRTRWHETLGKLVREIHPTHTQLLPDLPGDYFWSVFQSEWATDLVFPSIADLQPIYRSLLHHGITQMGSEDVMRYLGRQIHPCFKGEVVTDIKLRPEGFRIKHRVKKNSVKMYDKHGSVLRIETTINDPGEFKVLRPKDGDPNGPITRRPLRKGIADLKRRADVGQEVNDRYLNAFATLDIELTASDLLASCMRPARHRSRRVRALRPMNPDDRALIEAISRGEFLINGLRNRDLQPLLFDQPPTNKRERKRRMARVSRQLAMLRAHGIIRKMPRQHRYQLTKKGQEICATILALNSAPTNKLLRLAA